MVHYEGWAGVGVDMGTFAAVLTSKSVPVSPLCVKMVSIILSTA